MTCQHCQTWIEENDHRCPRCGRRMRSAPSRISPSTYPVAATATAHAYAFDTPSTQTQTTPDGVTEAREKKSDQASGQQSLFTQLLNGPRVIPIESYAARNSAQVRPAPVQTGKVELPRPKTGTKRKARVSDSQTSLDFQSAAAASPKQSIICDAVVAAPGTRLKAACIDAILMGAGCLVMLALFHTSGGEIVLDKRLLPYAILAFATVPLFYKVFWAIANSETPGMRRMGLRLVDFDGNPPASGRRYYRAGGSILSLLAAGIGVLWSLVDEDTLTWHDHISGTFPTSEF